jgi:aminopeptidase
VRNEGLFSSEELGAYARLLFWGLARSRRTPLRKSELVQVRFDLPALPLAEELCDCLLEEGLLPLARMLPTPRMERDLYAKANRRRLSLVPPGEQELADSLGGTITLMAPSSLEHLQGVDPESIALYRQSRRSLQESARMREQQGAYGWTLGLWPTPALAQGAGMPLGDYAEELARACYLGAGDAVAAWRRLARKLDGFKGRLNSLGNARVRVEAEDGTDFSVAIGEQRRWAGLTGRNIPSFELYVSPDWRTAEGVFCADMPTYLGGNMVSGMRLEFRQGRVTRFSARHGQEFAIRQLMTDEGAAQLGELALVDKRFSPIRRCMAHGLYDENFGGAHGSMHIALGQSYANTYAGEMLHAEQARQYGFNSSSLHWDLISTARRRVTAFLPAGTRVIYEDGEFTL